MTPKAKPQQPKKIARLFSNLSQPARLQILLVIREQEGCVCHLVAALELRQASISQHLMALRELGWVTNRREGRLIYYSLADPRLVALIEQAAAIAGISFEEMDKISRRPLENCPCPKCHPELPPEYSCKSMPPGYIKQNQGE